ncbi:hypothetical protein [Noviherbaspirillum pedocola]|uniref:Uncharacterized protein n=1 Tax=Noviherbaspirillum pedocola TaxID=2801341 RepID=A0A934SUI7_9BURK|nr:hypothetical protein [Noviherbaspirillum pedocola]MBK4735967.1 hypothetical protein [Noviherbaspirillum pedocola]
MHFTPRQVGAINLDRPSNSVTGALTVAASPELLEMLWQELSRSGYIIHSCAGKTAWATSRICREENYPYQVQVITDSCQRTVGIVVQRTDMKLGRINLPPRLRAAITEIYPALQKD